MAMVAQLGAPVQSSPGDVRADVPRGVPTAEVASAGRTAASGAPDFAARSRLALSGSPFADRLTAADYLWVERTLADFTLREKVAQLIMSYIEGGRPDEGGARWRRAVRLVEEERVGGLIVGVGPTFGTASWLNELQSLSTIPLLVTADLEWGPGTRLRGGTVLPINMALAAAGSPEYAYEAGRITALEARAAGIHMAFAPVADVNVNPENPVINTRSYGSDPGAVADRVVAFIRGARSAGLQTVAKHFPGHGDTETDSHLAMPVLGVGMPRLNEVELAPFRAAIGAEVEGVMTAHLAVPALDPAARPRPATLSPPILTNLLRRDLGFGGLVVTDALHMDGVKRHGRPGEVAVEAVLAGADVLLIPPDEPAAIDAVVAAVREGTLSEARIDLSVRRILAAKALAGLLTRRTVDVGVTLTQVGRTDHDAWGRRAAERSLTLVRGRPGALPLWLDGRSIVSVLYDEGRNHRGGEAFAEALSDRGARVTTVRISKYSSAATLERARGLAGAADIVIFASFSRALPWKGSLGLPERVAELARDLAADGAPVISFGDPYLLRQLPSVETYLLAWSEARVSQEAAAAALAGEIPITGRLPIDLPPYHQAGEGLVIPSLPGLTTVSLVH
ncbi:MAG TPA: glycoside hydrolase family 3 N-terminal domain-containing protein [Longimicrobiales bacterium]|nr:glycoside hydrolase family 3 N-terminal domain-containing protein [Longimicrobiales bacterium]